MRKQRILQEISLKKNKRKGKYKKFCKNTGIYARGNLNKYQISILNCKFHESFVSFYWGNESTLNENWELK